MADLSRDYAILGLRSGASLEEVKLAYRRLVKTWHPDRFPHDPLRQNQGERRMQEINAAYSQLEAVAPARPHGRRRGGSWDNLYSIGISNIDQEHQLFLEMLDNFNDNFASSAIITINDEAMMKIYLYVLKLRRYALKHFLTEEEYMVKYNYPNYYEHRKIHDGFIKQIFNIEEDYYRYNKLSPNNITNFILSWLEEHIKGMDKDLGRYLNDVIGI